MTMPLNAQFTLSTGSSVIETITYAKGNDPNSKLVLDNLYAHFQNNTTKQITINIASSINLYQQLTKSIDGITEDKFVLVASDIDAIKAAGALDVSDYYYGIANHTAVNRALKLGTLLEGIKSQTGVKGFNWINTKRGPLGVFNGGKAFQALDPVAICLYKIRHSVPVVFTMKGYVNYMQSNVVKAKYEYEINVERVFSYTNVYGLIRTRENIDNGTVTTVLLNSGLSPVYQNKKDANALVEIPGLAGPDLGITFVAGGIGKFIIGSEYLAQIITDRTKRKKMGDKWRLPKPKNGRSITKEEMNTVFDTLNAQVENADLGSVVIQDPNLQDNFIKFIGNVRGDLQTIIDNFNRVGPNTEVATPSYNETNFAKAQKHTPLKGDYNKRDKKVVYTGLKEEGIGDQVLNRRIIEEHKYQACDYYAYYVDVENITTSIKTPSLRLQYLLCDSWDQIVSPDSKSYFDLQPLQELLFYSNLSNTIDYTEVVSNYLLSNNSLKTYIDDIRDPGYSVEDVLDDTRKVLICESVPDDLISKLVMVTWFGISNDNINTIDQIDKPENYIDFKKLKEIKRQYSILGKWEFKGKVNP